MEIVWVGWDSLGTIVGHMVLTIQLEENNEKI